MHGACSLATEQVVTTDQAIPPIVGAILAGGLARRLGGGDKALRMVGDRTILARMADRLMPQVTRLVISANDDPRRFAGFRVPIVADSVLNHPGPLGGVLASLDWVASSAPDVARVLTVPGDVPFIPRDLVARLRAGIDHEPRAIACAASGGRRHPVIALWPVALREELRRAVAEEGIRRVETFLQRYSCSVADWPTDAVDPFFNVNTPSDLVEANRLVALHPDL
jgi:molybdopterin-guanine dinucleotide biosynthesis protein A